MPSSLNGTGVTFNDGTTLQSGNIPAANLGSGTANSNTFLRGDRTFATPPSQAPTTAQVLSATAGASAGAVGTYAFLATTTASNAGNNTFGSTRAGSNFNSAGFRVDSSTFNSSVVGRFQTATQAGTWRCMGLSSAFPEGFVAQRRPAGTLWLRIS